MWSSALKKKFWRRKQKIMIPSPFYRIGIDAPSYVTLYAYYTHISHKRELVDVGVNIHRELHYNKNVFKIR